MHFGAFDENGSWLLVPVWYLLNSVLQLSEKLSEILFDNTCCWSLKSETANLKMD